MNTCESEETESRYTTMASPLGRLTIVTSTLGLCGLYFEQHRYFSGTGGWQADPSHPYLRQARQQLQEYFDGSRKNFDLPLNLTGTPFQLAVWRQLTTIKFGQAVSYSEHAKQIGRAAAVRAVGTAIGRNPLSIIVPCHRVLGKNGALTGYAGGIERKRFLLALENPPNATAR